MNVAIGHSFQRTLLSNSVLMNMGYSGTDHPDVVTIKAVGDIVLRSDHYTIPGTIKPDHKVFDHVRPALYNADILFGNLEGPITGYRYSAKDTTRENIFAFRFPRGSEKVLQSAGFNALQVTNNHCLDFHQQGHAETKQLLSQENIAVVGVKDTITYMHKGPIKIALIGFYYHAQGNRIHDEEVLKRLIREAKRQAQLVIITFHGGGEASHRPNVMGQEEIYAGEKRGNVLRFAHVAIDTGADCVIGHGPHFLRAMEFYKGKLIAYSLGNFMGYGGTLARHGRLGYSVILELQIHKSGKFISGRAIPVYLDDQGIPRFDPQNRGIKALQELSQQDFPASCPIITNDGLIKLQSNN